MNYDYTYSAVIKSQKDYAKYYNQEGEAGEITAQELDERIIFLKAEIDRQQIIVGQAQVVHDEWAAVLYRATDCAQNTSRSGRQGCIEYWTDEYALTNYINPSSVNLTLGLSKLRTEAGTNLQNIRLVLDKEKATLATFRGNLVKAQEDLDLFRKLAAEAGQEETQFKIKRTELGIERGKQFGLYAGIGIAVLGAGYLILTGLRK